MFSAWTAILSVYRKSYENGNGRLWITDRFPPRG